MAPRIKRETFAPVDAAWLRMDTPTNLMMINGVMMFAEPIDIVRLKEVVSYRLLRHERFRQRVRQPALPLGLPTWETDPHFDLNAHVHRIALPQPGDMTALQELVGDMMSCALDPNKPLWHLYVVDNFRGGGAIICRLHHCLADGLALMDVLLSLTDHTPDAPVALPQVEERRAGWLEELLRSAAATTKTVAKGAELLWNEGFMTLQNPSHALELAQRGGDYAAALGKLLLMLPDRRTILRGKCGVVKRAVWSDPIPLSDIKAIGHRLESTVNDVLLAAVSGALRRYLESRGQTTKGLDIRAMIPVNLRQPAEMGKLGNRFGLVILSLPVGIRDPLHRLAAVKKRMDDIKRSPEAVVAFGILTTIGLTPVDIERIIVGIFASKVTAVMTNVPGPKETLYLAGSRLTGLMFWVPTASNLGLGISIISYAGEVIIGFMTDKGLVPDPEVIVEGFHAELDEMRELLVASPQAAQSAEPGVIEPAETEVSATEPEEVAQSAVVQAPVPEAASSGRCQALTRAGRPCKNRALPGEVFCRTHLTSHG